MDNLVDSAQPAIYTDWFTTTTRSQFTPASCLYDAAQHERSTWEELPPYFRLAFDMEEKVGAWLKETSESELASLLAQLPSGISAGEHAAAFQFTKYQLLSMHFWLHRPFSLTCSIHLPAEGMRTLGEYSATEKSPKEGLTVSMCQHGGSAPKEAIVDFLPGCGKTAFCLAAGGTLVARSSCWVALQEEHRAKAAGEICEGDGSGRLARLVLIAAAANTFSHFEDTLARLLPELRRLWPSNKYLVWTRGGATRSVDAAAALDPSCVVFWIVTMETSKKALSACPNTAIAALIYDEFTIDTPRTRGTQASSHALKVLYANATMQALTECTRGNTSRLKRAFNGKTIIPPSELPWLCRHRKFNDTRLAMQQSAQLRLMSMAQWRGPIRCDLSNLMPTGILVLAVRCRFQSFAAALHNAQVDIEPASLPVALFRYLTPLQLDAQTKQALQQALESACVTSQTLRDTLGTTDSGLEALLSTIVERLLARLDEFTAQCPICFDAGTACHIMACCGYVLCASCNQGLRRCAFCRAEETPSTEVTRRVQIPTAPAFVEVVDGQQPRTLQDDLISFAREEHTQLHNLALVLHTALHHGYKRLLVLVEPAYGHYAHAGNFRYLELDAISRATGISLHTVQHLIRGKGTAFAQLKRAFDNPASAPMGLVAYGDDKKFVVGTDMASVDMMIVAGEIENQIITQTLGRIFRPLLGRDNSRPVPIVRVFTGNQNHGRRRRW